MLDEIHRTRMCSILPIPELFWMPSSFTAFNRNDIVPTEKCTFCFVLRETASIRCRQHIWYRWIGQIQWNILKCIILTTIGSRVHSSRILVSHSRLLIRMNESPITKPIFVLLLYYFIMGTKILHSYGRFVFHIGHIIESMTIPFANDVF